MVHCTLYKIAKKTNSTRRPEDIAGIFSAERNGEFKGRQSLLAPVVNFVGVTETTIPPAGQDPVTYAPRFNYAYIKEFERYYFITEWTFDGGIWTAQMSVDVLATYRDEILAMNAYVLRSSSYHNPKVIDTIFPAATEYEVKTSSFTPWANCDFTTGSVIFGVISQDGTTTTGAVCYYACSPQTFRQIMNRLLSSPNYMNINTDEVGEQLQKAIINPSQYLVSANYVPDNIHEGYAALRTLYVGWWNIGQYQLAPLTEYPGQKYSRAWGFVNYQHPQTEQLGVWVNTSPYTTAQLEFWPWGIMPIDTEKLIWYDELTVAINYDLITGVGLLQLIARKKETGESAVISANTCQFATPLQIAQITVDYGALNVGTGIAATAAGVATSGQSLINNLKSYTKSTISNVKGYFNLLKGLVTGNNNTTQTAYSQFHDADAEKAQVTDVDIADIAGGVGDALNSALASPVVRGGAGGIMMYGMAARLTYFYRQILPQAPEDIGRPACRYFRLGDITGFCKILEAHFEANRATTNEQEIVNKYLESGFYLEYPQGV